MPIGNKFPLNTEESFFYTSNKQGNDKLSIKEYSIVNKEKETVIEKIDKVQDRIVKFEKNDTISISNRNLNLKNRKINQIEIKNKDTGNTRVVRFNNNINFRVRSEEESKTLIKELVQYVILIGCNTNNKKIEKEKYEKPTKIEKNNNNHTDHPQIVKKHLFKEQRPSFQLVENNFNILLKRIDRLREDESIREQKKIVKESIPLCQ